MKLSLDDLYWMTAHIYGDRNSSRSKENTLAHFVEVCGMLTVESRQKKRDSFNFSDALCKALAWYFPLLAKMKIKSAEDLIFRKFPNLCPYCRCAPHVEGICKSILGTEETVDKSLVIDAYEKERNNRPCGLDEWQAMFQHIFPRARTDGARSILGLFEELGELAEAVRVFDMHPQYFFGEAADIFSYIMGLANEHLLRERQEGREFSFEREYLKRYPGLCIQCGYRVCNCPTIPPSTIGRLAKELEITSSDNPYITDLADFKRRGEVAARQALESVGGYASLPSALLQDTGEENRGLANLCLAVADYVEGVKPSLAASLRSEAIRPGGLAGPGESDLTARLNEIVRAVRDQFAGGAEQSKSVRRSDH